MRCRFARCSPRVGGREHRGAVNVAARLAGQLANALHLLPHRSAAVDSISIELDSHRVRVEIVQIDFNLKNVPLRVSPNLQFSEV